MRHTYASAFVVSTIGNDPTNTIQQFMIAYGGKNIVAKDGKFNGKDPASPRGGDQGGRAARRPLQGRLHPAELDQLERRRRQQRVPLQALRDGFRRHACRPSWRCSASRRPSTTTSSPCRRRTHNDGSQMACQFGTNCLMIPKGAKNVDVAKDFAKYVIQPEINGKYLKGGLGRWLPVYPGCRQERPVVDRPQARPAPAALCRPGVWRQGASAVLFRLQSGLGAGAQRASVQRRDARRHIGGCQADRGRRQGVQADRRDLRDIPDQGLRGQPWRTAHLSSRPSGPARPPARTRRRGAAGGAATCRARNTPGPSHSACPISPCSSPLSSTRWALACGWAATRRCIRGCSTIRSTGRRWSTPRCSSASRST